MSETTKTASHKWLNGLFRPFDSRLRRNKAKIIIVIIKKRAPATTINAWFSFESSSIHDFIISIWKWSVVHLSSDTSQFIDVREGKKNMIDFTFWHLCNNRFQSMYCPWKQSIHVWIDKKYSPFNLIHKIQ